MSIVIPAYNEELRIDETLRRICNYLDRSGRKYEVVVVDDGSSDSTVEVVNRRIQEYPSIRLIHNGANRGKGYSVKRGVIDSTGELVLMSDADLSTPIEEFDKLKNVLDEGYDIAIGSRAMRESNIIKKQAWYRQLMGKTFNKFIQIFAVWGVKDTQCGFKLFKGTAAREIFPAQKIDGFAFDVEVLYLARKAGLKCAEVPVVWVNSPASKVKIVRDSLRMLRDLIKIKFIHR